MPSARSSAKAPPAASPASPASPAAAAAAASAAADSPRDASPAASAGAKRAARSAPTPLPLARARAWWHLRQGLAQPVAASADSGAHSGIAAVVAATSWPRTLGGIDVYLSTRARIAGLRRAELDAAVERRAVQVVPAVRGCIYLVPRQLAPLCLRVAEDQWRPRTDREIQKAGTTWSEIEGVAAAARAALAGGPLTADGLRRALPPGTLRSFGEAGKKVGIASPLPLALRLLEFAGTIERTLPGGHLDSERYEWRLVAAPAPDAAPVPDSAAGRAERLAAIFFAGAAPATVKDFAGWAGLSQQQAQQAVAQLPLIPVQVPGYAESALAFAEDLREAPPSSTISLLPFEDNYLTAHGGLAVLTEPEQHDRAMPVWGSPRSSPLAQSQHITLRPILAGPRVIGFWEYDPDAQRVVHAAFETAVPPAALAAAAESLTAFLRDELQHGRSFSLDTDDALRTRARQVLQVSA